MRVCAQPLIKMRWVSSNMCLCISVYLCVLDKLSAERVKQVMEHIWRMQEFCNSMIRVSPDAYEYAYLKATVLFSPGNRALHAKSSH